MDQLALIVDFVLHVNVHLQSLMNNYGLWVYAILFLIIFCETGLVVTPFLPGDSLLFAAGALTVGTALDVHTLAILLVTAAVLGNLTNYTIGHFFGERLYRNPDSKIFRRDHLAKTQNFFAKHGGKTVIITRFLPILRTVAPFVAGMGAMHYKRFMVFNFVGGLLWVTSFLYAGHFFGNMPAVKQNFSILMIGIIVISLLPMLIGTVRHRMKRAQA
ncbi:DedA family protein [Pseudaeromonas sharmana]|uniref:DedA family protein n=1 Tax=Pseudaeromonas sharmana TaxID=328412 RepID=A0ABV8CN69_9GAMM